MTYFMSDMSHIASEMSHFMTDMTHIGHEVTYIGPGIMVREIGGWHSRLQISHLPHQSLVDPPLFDQRGGDFS